MKKRLKIIGIFCGCVVAACFIGMIAQFYNKKDCIYDNIKSGKKYETSSTVFGKIKSFGDYIYYVNDDERSSIYKVKKDGTDRHKLLNSSADIIDIKEGWIYYNHHDGHGVNAICRMKLDGTKKTELDKGYCYNSNIINGWIYYSGEKGLYKIKLDGTGKQLINKNVSGKIETVMEGWIYYLNDSDDYKLYKIKTDGTQMERISDISVMNDTNVVVIGSWIYFVSGGEGLNAIKTDGTISMVLIMRAGGITGDDKFVYCTSSLGLLKIDGFEPVKKITDETLKTDVIGMKYRTFQDKTDYLNMDIIGKLNGSTIQIDNGFIYNIRKKDSNELMDRYNIKSEYYESVNYK